MQENLSYQQSPAAKYGNKNKRRNLAGGPICLIFMKWSAVCRGEENAPCISKTWLAILTRAVGGWGLSADSSAIRTITPKEGLVLNVAAFRKEGSTTDSAHQKALKSVKPALNIRATLAWFNFKISTDLIASRLSLLPF